MVMRKISLFLVLFAWSDLHNSAQALMNDASDSAQDITG